MPTFLSRQKARITMHYNYCPTCGTKLVPKHAGDDGDVPYCEKCDKLWFDSFSSCVIVLTYNEFGEVVVCKQSYISDVYYTLTSGYMTPGENAEESALREVKEEIGLDLEKLDYAGTYWFEGMQILMHGFMGFIHKQDLTLSEEVDEAIWVPAEEGLGMLFPDAPGNAAYKILQKYLEEKEGKNHGTSIH